MNVVVTFSMITVLIGTDVSKLSVGRVTFGICGVGLAVGTGDAVGGAVGVAVAGGVGVAVAGGVGVAVGGTAVAVGVGGTGVAVGVAPGGVAVGVGVGPVMVIIPLFCNGECEFRSVSMNSKSFGNGCQTNSVNCPGVLLTLTHLVLKRTPAPLSGVTPSFTKADTRKVLNVPGPVFSTFEPTVHPVAVSPAP
jgi:hypothetical protein